MIKDHSYSEKGKPLLPIHVLLFSIRSKGYFLRPIEDTTPFVKTVVELWLEREIPQSKITRKANLEIYFKFVCTGYAYRYKAVLQNLRKYMSKTCAVFCYL